MIRKFFSLFTETITSLHAAAYTIALFAFLSQILGLGRDRMLAHIFGAGSTLDVYYAAFRVPDFIFASVASVVSLFVLIPFLSERLEEGGKERAREFLSQMTTFFCLFIGVASIVLFVFAPHLGLFLYPGFGVAEQEAFVELTRILLLSPIFLGLSNILSSVTQLTGRFLVYATAPILYNLAIIIGIVAFYPTMGLMGIGWGVVLGAVLHLLIQVPTVARENLMPRLRLLTAWREIRMVVGASFPRTVTLALNQLVLLVLVGFASTLATGSVAVFTFASNLYMAPLSLIGVSYSVAAFPVLSKLHSRGEQGEFLTHLLTALRHILFWSFPVLALCIVLRAHIVRTLLGSGAFDWSDTRLTAAVFALFMLSLAAHAVILLFVRGYYAAGKTMRPLIVTLVSSAITVSLVFASGFISTTFPSIKFFAEALFRITDVPGTAIILVAFAYSLGLIVNALIFWVLFRRDFGGHIPTEIRRTLWHSLGVSIIAGAAAYVVLRLTQGMFDLSSGLEVFAQGALAGVTGILVWALVLSALKNPELAELVKTLHTRFWDRGEVIAPEPEAL